MKKLIIILLAGLAAVATVRAADEYTQDPNMLPAKARTMLSKNFKSKINVIKIDKTLGHTNDYEVVMTDGTVVEFNNKGDWKEIEVGRDKSVPDAMIPPEIRSYVKQYQKRERIIGIEKDRKGYEITLANGVEMKFDSKGSFKKYD